jgi:ribonuclease P protein component
MTMTKQYGLGRAQKLKSRKSIEQLFARGRSLACYPLRVKYSVVPLPSGPAAVQVGVTVSKKHFKKAVDRNRIKRLVREAYRLQQAGLLQAVQQSGRQAQLFFMYTDKSLPAYETVFNAMTACLAALQQKMIATNESPG